MFIHMIDYKRLFDKESGYQDTFPECYAFSLHKAGSTLMHGMIGKVCLLANIQSVNIPTTLFKEGVFEKDWENDERILSLITPGRVYYGFRQLPKVLLHESLLLREKKSVLLIRDPRDALVSEYFSFGGKNVSHALPDKNQEAFLKKRQASFHMDIDQYVLHGATAYHNKLKAYKNNLNFYNVLLFKYEDIYFDKRKFLGDIFIHFGIEVESKLLEEVASKYDIRPEFEDTSKHIRKGIPGDYASKLRSDTINKLNDIFADTCAWYGYDLIR
jgi:Sulfotransferase domain